MGKKSSKSKSTTTMPKWAQRHAEGAANLITGTVNANQPHLDAMASDIRGHLPQLSDMAFGPNPGLDAAMSYGADVLGGKYLDRENPYINDMVRIAGQNVGNTVNSTFSRSGRTGGGNHAGRLAQGLSDSELGIRYQNYAGERQNQQAMAGMMPGLNASRFAGVAPWLAATQTAGTLPYAGLGNLSSMGQLWAGQGTTTTKETPSWWQVAMNAAASAAAASDRRLKKDIVKVGEFEDGLGIYEWTYRADTDAQRYRGVMADEVKELRPAAYIPNFVGEYAGVNYALIGGVK